ncbi:MAG: GNAT family N-acetyltransferase [Propionibacteriaceae bacterium]|nr:GNAT family N-acetyltransferase [Propionibacteriaceae bacterium]
MPSDLLSLTLPATAPEPAPGIRLRPMSEADAEALAHLYLAAYPPEVGAADLEEAREEMRASFAGEYGELRPDASLLALIDGDPAGAVMTTTHSIWDEDLEGPFIIDLFADPQFQGRGVGRALVSAAVSACSQAGDGTLSLRVGEGTSPAAFRLYESLGFRHR